MTKTEIRNTIETILGNHKHSKALSTELLAAFEVKASGSLNPPKKVDGVMNYWCKFHKRYEVVENMVMSKDKSKGYCKAGISRWTKGMNQAKIFDKDAMIALVDGNTEEAAGQAKMAAAEREKAKDYESYDYDLDWSNFTGANKEDDTPVKPTRKDK